MSTIVEVVGAAILDAEGRVLAARRGPDMSLPGQWEFPGGKVEAGESHPESLRREIAEELGISIRVGDFIAMGEAPLGGGRLVQLHVYAATWVSGELVPQEHDQIRWVAPDALSNLGWAEADLPAVDKLSGTE